MGTFLSMNESAYHAENQEPVPCGIQGTDWRAGESPPQYESLAREFEPCATTIHGWVKKAGLDAGERPDGRAYAAGKNSAAGIRHQESYAGY